MASLSPQGERAILALLADLYAQNVDLRAELEQERAAHEATRDDLETLRAAVLADAEGPEPAPPI